METLVDVIQWIGVIGKYLYPINFLLGIVIVFFERRNPASLWAWLLLMYFIPVLGFVLYLFIGQDLRRKKLFEIKEVEDRLQEQVHIQEENFLNHNLVMSDTRLENYIDTVQLHLNGNKSIYTNDNEVQVFIKGEDKFETLKKDLREAKRFIHMEYYIIRHDFLAEEIMEILTQKVKEGVEVRLLFDGMGCLQVPKKFFAEFRKHGGKTGEFFPPLVPYMNLRLNFRNHRKICVIDGEIGYVGGFNIGKEYLGLGPLGYWRDTHLKIQGSAVDSLQFRFAQDWNFTVKENLFESNKYSSERTFKGNVGMQIVSSGPDSKWQNVKNGYLKLISEAEESIYIQTPYLILDDSLLETLKIAALSGIDVRVMIPNKPDHMFVYWASYSYLGELIQAGVKCYTYDTGFIHSKVIMVDGIASSVGTANMDIRSFKLNFEVNAFIYDSALTEDLEQIFMDDLKSCSEVTEAIYNQRSLKIKFKESISRMLSPIL